MKFNFKDMSEELRKIMKFNIKFKRQIELKDNKKKEVKRMMLLQKRDLCRSRFQKPTDSNMLHRNSTVYSMKVFT